MSGFAWYVVRALAKEIGSYFALPFMLAALIVMWPVMALIEGYERDKIRQANEKRWAAQRKDAMLAAREAP